MSQSATVVPARANRPLPTTASEPARRTARPSLRGAFTALVTPFTADGALDEAAFRRLVRWQILAGIDGLVPCGTTGESPTLSIDERERLIGATVEVARERASRDRVRVVAGTGSNDTAATIRATRRAAELGADAALVVAPYYNRPDSRMLGAHFRAIADEGDLPIVVYNVPSRTGSNVDADTFLRLADHPRVIGVKEASGNLDQIARICRDRPRDVAVLAGDDAWTLPVLAMGGDGVVSVASNEIPTELVALCAAARAGDWDGARRIHERWLPLFQGNFRGGPNPVPAKAALALMGLLDTDMVRAPLLPIDPDGRAALAVLLRGLGLLETGGGRLADRPASQEAVA
ncbi:MAG TPA: 4-hydroxy-tetrahydrodipicolinate synthase [Frankiaceae bacterium]|nr:4-hydroxy-tetrahydrodipicolinate synthase [Frankiaceae bacterium]